MLSQSGKVGIGRQVSGSSEALKRLAQVGKMTRGWVNDVDVGQLEPRFDSCRRFCDRQGAEKDLSVRGNTKKTQQNDPSEADALGSSQRAIPPSFGRSVNRRIRVVGVNEDVDVGKDHIPDRFRDSA